MATADLETIPSISINGPDELNGDLSDDVSDLSNPEEAMVNHVGDGNSVSSNENSSNSNIDAFAQSIVENVILSSIANLYVEKIIENVKNSILNGEYDNLPLLNGVGSTESREVSKPRGRARAGPVVAFDPDALKVSTFEISDEDDVCMDSEVSESDLNSESPDIQDIQERLKESGSRIDPVPSPDSPDEEPRKVEDVDVRLSSSDDQSKTPEDTGGGAVTRESTTPSEPTCAVNLIPATPEKEEPDEEFAISEPAAQPEPAEELAKKDNSPTTAAPVVAVNEQPAAPIAESDITPHPEEDRASPPKDRQEIPKEDAKKAKKKRLSSFRNLFTCCATGRSSE